MTEPRLRAAAIVLSLLGIAVAGYLTYVHYAELSPVCVGGSDACERVQASDQAQLLGVPVALLGLLGYAVLLACSLVVTETARVLGALTAITGFGFSLYLQYEAIAVIEATCQWCVASAALMTLLAAVTTARLLKAP